jgi:single-strand DNA-binding protein
MAKDPNLVTIRGRIASDPAISTTGSGANVVSFTIASNGRVKNRSTNEWEDGETTWWHCSAWRDLADHVVASLPKGTEVIALGRPHPNSYRNKDGAQVTRLEWVLDDIAASVQHATLQVTRIKSKPSGFKPSRNPEPQYSNAENSWASYE